MKDCEATDAGEQERRCNKEQEDHHFDDKERSQDDRGWAPGIGGSVLSLPGCREDKSRSRKAVSSVGADGEKYGREVGKISSVSEERG